MSDMLVAPGESTSGWKEGRAGAVRIRPGDPPSSNSDGSDLQFIDTVLADLIEFAQLNRLEDLEADLVATRANFVQQIEYADERQQLAG